MYRFTADPRDGAIGGGCSTCCCVSASAKPGETNKWYVDYAPWSIPLGGPGITDNTLFDIEQREGCPQSSAEIPSVDSPALFQTPLNTALAGSLVASVNNPNAAPLVFSKVVFGGPTNGVLTLNADGTFNYVPAATFNGFDRFWWQVEVDGGKPLVGEAVIGVGSAGMPTAAQGTPAVAIVKNSEQVNQQSQALSFGVAVSPAAQIGCVYRLSIKQQAFDCENCYTHLSCFDIKIVKC